jgi:Male sterility protein
MIKIQTKIYGLMVSFRRFSLLNYDIDITNTKTLFDGMSGTDQKKFMFDVDQVSSANGQNLSYLQIIAFSQIVWPLQIENNVRGIRKFIFKENDDSVLKAVEKMNR